MKDDPRPIARAMRAPIRRRAALAGIVGLCANFVPRQVLPQVSPEAVRARPQPGDVLVRAAGDDHRPLTVADIALGEKPVAAWPLDPASDTLRNGSRLNKILILRLDADGFDPPTKANAADGVLAYSAICPHTGCDVANWLAEPQILECPCHFSHYDPKAGAKVISGPSPRRLAALPLAADGNSKLTVATLFIGRLGVVQQS